MTSLYIFSLISTLLYALAIVLFVGLHLYNRDFSIVRHAVSDYAIGKAARFFQVYLFTGTLGASVLAYVFYQSDHPNFPTRVALYLVLMVMARLGTAAFKTDIEGEKVTFHGRLHYLFAVLQFTFAYMAIAAATPVFLHTPITWLFALLKALQLAVMVALAGVVVSVFPPLRRFFGLVERLFLLCLMLWFLFASLGLTLFNAGIDARINF